MSEKINEFINYHITEKISFIENIFRPYSENYFTLIKEGRKIYEQTPNLLSEEDYELYNETELGLTAIYENEEVMLDFPMEIDMVINEALYKGKEVALNRPQRSSGPKKYRVFVKDPKTGNVKKINFGDVSGGLTAKIGDPKRRKAFSDRHNCPAKKDKTKAGYWACRLTKFGHLFNNKTYSGYW